MTDPTTSGVDELALITARIEETIAERIVAGKPAFVSAIGIALHEDLTRLKALSGLSLTDFLRKQLADRYDVIETKPSTFALWPKGQPFIPTSRQATHEPRGRDYARWFWLAFASPLTQGTRFYDPDSHEVITSDEATSDGWIEIPDALIRKAGEPFHPRTILENIETWLDDNQLDRKLFEVDAVGTKASRPHDTRSVLDLVLDCLDKKQLQGVTVSLDVVASLARTRA